MPVLFITATDTGVGKTVVTAGLSTALAKAGYRVCVYKPIQTGCQMDNDLATVKRLSQESVITEGTYRFIAPTAPWIADQLENKGASTIRPFFIVDKVRELQAQHDWVVVEGAGGVRVPVTEDLDMLDLIQDMACSALVVTRPDLGTINHTRLTLEALGNKGVPVLGVVVSGFPSEAKLQHHEFPEAIQTLPDVFRQFLASPVLAWLPKFELKYGFTDEQLQSFRPIVDALTNS